MNLVKMILGVMNIIMLILMDTKIEMLGLILPLVNNITINKIDIIEIIMVKIDLMLLEINTWIHYIVKWIKVIINLVLIINIITLIISAQLVVVMLNKIMEVICLEDLKLDLLEVLIYNLEEVKEILDFIIMDLDLKVVTL